jgi:NAD(P)H-nitrite reductase large subunit
MSRSAGSNRAESDSMASRASHVSFLEGTGAQIDEGIVIDDHMRTTVPCIYAAGDVAQGRDFSTGEWAVV